MDIIADILLAAGALGATVYCIVLAGRLNRFNNLQNGVGGAVAVLSAQVDDMTKTLEKAQKASVRSAMTLTSLTERAEDVSRRLELMLASMHDLPEPAEFKESPAPEARSVHVETSTERATKAVMDKATPPQEACFSTRRTRVLEAAE